MSELRKIKRKDLDLEKYSKAINDALNYRIYAEYWYLDILTKEKWECWIYGNYEAVMPVPLQYKFGFKFVLQPIYCQQLGVFYKDEIPDELFREFEKKLHRYRVRAYHFNEENTECYKPEGERRVNYVLDLNRPYEEVYKRFRKDRKKNIIKVDTLDFELSINTDYTQYFKLIQKNYPHLYQFIENNEKFFQTLDKRNCLIQYSICIDGIINNHRVFMVSKNRIYAIASARNKKSEVKLDFSTYLFSVIIQEFAGQKRLLDFEGSMNLNIADFNNSFGSEKRDYTHYSNIRF